MRTLFFVLCAVLSLAILPAQADEYVVTADSLNVRSLPMVESDKVGTLRRGDVVQATISLGFADWIGVELPDGTSGFVSSRYVERVRVDAFNADFLQILPQDNPIFLSKVLSNFHYGLQRENMVTPSANGRFLVFTPPQDGAYVYDTVIDRVTRWIDTDLSTVTNDFLVYQPTVDGAGFGVSLPSLEVMRLDTTDDISSIDPKSLGWDRFIGLFPVAGSNLVLTQVDRPGDARLVLLNVEQQQIVADIGSVKDDHGYLNIEFYPAGDGRVLALRFQAHNELGGVGYVVNVDTWSIEAKVDYPEMLTRSLYDVFMPDQDVLLMRGDQDFDRNLFVALHTRTGQLLWTRPDSFSGPRLIVNQQGHLIEEIDPFSEQPRQQRISPRTGANIGGVTAYTPLPDNYERVWRSNDGAVEVAIRGELSRLDTVLPGATYQIRRQGQIDGTPRAFSAVVSKFMDIAYNEEGDEVLRILLRGLEDSAYFEWPLTAPEPSIAIRADANLEWVSGAVQGQHRLAIFNEESLYELHRVFIRNFQDYAAQALEPRDGIRMNAPNLDDCRAGFPMERIDSYRGRYARFPNCTAIVDPSAISIIAEPNGGYIDSDQASTYPHTVRQAYDCPYNTTENCAEIDTGYGSGRFLSLDSWDFVAAEEMRDGSEMLNLSRFDPRQDTLTLEGSIPMAQINSEVYRYFVKSDDFGSEQPPEMKNVIGYGPDPAFFVRGTRIGETEDRLWFVEFDRAGRLKGEPRLVRGQSDSHWLGYSIHYNGEVFVFTNAESVTVVNSGLEVRTVARFDNPENVPPHVALGENVFVLSTSPFAYGVYSLATGDLLATFFADADANAVSLLGNGYFASNGPAAAQSLIIRNRETGSALPIQSVFDSLYRPDLVQQALLGDPDRRVANAVEQLSLATIMETGGAPALVDIDAPQAVSDDYVVINATALLNSSGLGSVIWKVNGVTVGVDASMARVAGEGNGQRFSLERSLPLEVGENRVSVQVTSHAGTIYSEPLETRVFRTSGGTQSAPRLFVLAVGVDDYDDPNLQLNYAVNDARAVTEALQSGASDQYDEVNIRTLYDGDVNLANLSAEFDAIAADIKPSDTFIFFLAGHGVTFDGRYYFLPPNINVQESPAAALATYGVSQTMWRQLFSQISAMRSLILFDSCESGSAVRMEAARSLEQGAGISRLAQATGRAIITAAAETQVALEGYEGHGAFTHTILDAFLNGDANDDGILNLTELGDHLTETLPAITQEKWSYTQDPQVFIEGTPFDIANIVR